MHDVRASPPFGAAAVKHEALALGFELCGIAPAGGFPELRFLDEWITRGYAGEMHYLERTAGRRADVRSILPSARSVIVLGTVYNTKTPYSTTHADRGRAEIARYAWGDDYHVVIERRLHALVERLREMAGGPLEARAYVDTGPVQERVYAQYAGVGWIGKNTCVISRDLGSWLFLSVIITDKALDPDPPALDQCGTCTLCIEACPTDALVEPHVLDATRCLSYVTIELKGPVPPELRDGVGAHAYGCDICQEVCPWNSTPAESADPAWRPRDGLANPPLLDLWRMSDDGLRGLLKGSAMKRAGVKRLRRNLAVAIGNSGDAGAAAVLSGSHEPAARDPLVEEHVAWAVGKLDG